MAGEWSSRAPTAPRPGPDAGATSGPVPRNHMACCGLPGLTAPNLSRSPVQSSEGRTFFFDLILGGQARAPSRSSQAPLRGLRFAPKFAHSRSRGTQDHRKHWGFMTTTVPPHTPSRRAAAPLRRQPLHPASFHAIERPVRAPIPGAFPPWFPDLALSAPFVPTTAARSHRASAVAQTRPLPRGKLERRERPILGGNSPPAQRENRAQIALKGARHRATTTSLGRPAVVSRVTSTRPASRSSTMTSARRVAGMCPVNTSVRI